MAVIFARGLHGPFLDAPKTKAPPPVTVQVVDSLEQFQGRSSDVQEEFSAWLFSWIIFIVGVKHWLLGVSLHLVALI